MRKILFATSEAYPLIKTGGLGDVAGSLPLALRDFGQEVRLILPAYATVLEVVKKTRCMARINTRLGLVRILIADMPGQGAKLWLVDYPPFYDRPGNPYLGPDGMPWHDNADRFALFCQVVVEIAMRRTSLRWQADIIHCHDWQTGLIPALLAQEEQAPPTVFTIHNLAYQGLYPYSTFVALGLPPALWTYEAVEFHGQMSFIKGGLAFADRITTVSPSYAEEIKTPALGYGLEGLLTYRSAVLSGILNGIDTQAWNPETDPHIARHYSIRAIDKKKVNKIQLQQESGLPQKELLLLGFVGRLVHQKGIDIILQGIHELMKLPVQLVFLGSGDYEYEQSLRYFQEQYPQQMAVTIGYNEVLAHRIEAGVDAFMMPSRFEPCGLNQMYSLRYGTLPVVRKVGGLADTVVHCNTENIEAGKANGFVMEGDQAWDFVQLIQQVLEVYDDKPLWKKLQMTAMWQDSSWDKSAIEYKRLYDQLDQA